VTGPTPPPPPPGAGGYPGEFGAAPQKQQNVFGVLALILGIVSIIVCCFYGGIWAGIPGIVLGVIGINKAGKGRASNRGLAMTGVVLSVIGLLLTVVLVGYIGFTDTGKCIQDARGDQQKVQDCFEQS
jgi:hypothetical protein